MTTRPNSGEMSVIRRLLAVRRRLLAVIRRLLAVNRRLLAVAPSGKVFSCNQLGALSAPDYPDYPDYPVGSRVVRAGAALSLRPALRAERHLPNLRAAAPVFPRTVTLRDAGESRRESLGESLGGSHPRGAACAVILANSAPRGGTDAVTKVGKNSNWPALNFRGPLEFLPLYARARLGGSVSKVGENRARPASNSRGTLEYSTLYARARGPEFRDMYARGGNSAENSAPPHGVRPCARSVSGENSEGNSGGTVANPAINPANNPAYNAGYPRGKPRWRRDTDTLTRPRHGARIARRGTA